MEGEDGDEEGDGDGEGDVEETEIVERMEKGREIMKCTEE
jgi:hypothetical protein